MAKVNCSHSYHKMEETREVHLGQQLEGHSEGNMKLFEASGLRNPEYWQCIRYIAPDDVMKNKWKSSDAIGVYCTVCKERIKYDSSKNSHGVKRHMDRFHSDLVAKYREMFPNKKDKKRRSDGRNASCSSKKSKTKKKAKQAKETKETSVDLSLKSSNMAPQLVRRSFPDILSDLENDYRVERQHSSLIDRVNLLEVSVFDKFKECALKERVVELETAHKKHRSILDEMSTICGLPIEKYTILERIKEIEEISGLDYSIMSYDSRITALCRDLI